MGDNGKSSGNYENHVVYWGSMGIMEKKMEATIVYCFLYIGGFAGIRGLGFRIQGLGFRYNPYSSSSPVE